MLVSKNIITKRLKAVSRFRSNKRRHISLLEGLPLELLQSIASYYLPISAAASFALSSKYICYVVGRQYWHHVRFDRLEYMIFLGFLEKDMPDHWLCTQCLTFHSKPTMRMTYHFVQPEWKCAHPLDHISAMSWPFTIPYTRILYFMVRMVMNRHLFGPEHGERLDILTQPSCKDSFRDGRGTTSTEACIVANELYVRYQYRVAIPFSEDFGYIRPIAICPHISWWERENAMAPIIKSLLNERNTASGEKCKGGLRQCRSCTTEFEIQISQFKATGHVLEITYWKNLGAGRSPGDPKWVQHLLCPHIPPGLQAAKFSPGSIQSAFEWEKHKNSICNANKRNRLLKRSKRVLGQVCAAFT